MVCGRVCFSPALVKWGSQNFIYMKIFHMGVIKTRHHFIPVRPSHHIFCLAQNFSFPLRLIDKSFYGKPRRTADKIFFEKVGGHKKIQPRLIDGKISVQIWVNQALEVNDNRNVGVVLDGRKRSFGTEYMDHIRVEILHYFFKGIIKIVIQQLTGPIFY